MDENGALANGQRAIAGQARSAISVDQIDRHAIRSPISDERQQLSPFERF